MDALSSYSRMQACHKIITSRMWRSNCASYVASYRPVISAWGENTLFKIKMQTIPTTWSLKGPTVQTVREKIRNRIIAKYLGQQPINLSVLSLLAQWLWIIFRRVRKIAKSDHNIRYACPSVRPSVRMEQLGSHWTDFLTIWYLGIFRKSVEKIQVSLKSDKNSGYFT